MSRDNTANWMDEEEERATQQAEIGATPNAEAPQLVRKQTAPPRSTKGFYVQEKYSMAFDRLVFTQKQAKGKKAPELAEEAIELLLEKYGMEL